MVFAFVQLANRIEAYFVELLNVLVVFFSPFKIQKKKQEEDKK